MWKTGASAQVHNRILDRSNRKERLVAWSTPDLIDTPYEEYKKLSLTERLRISSASLAEIGLGSPRNATIFYLVKCTAYVLIGLAVSTLFAGVGNPLNVSNWWAEPIVYQKFLMFAILWELCGLGASSGPAGFHYVPKFGANKYWSKVGVIKRPPFAGRLPGQGGDTRSLLDVVLYYTLIASLIVAIVFPPTNHNYVADYIPGAEGGMLPNWCFLVPILLILAIGYRCQHLFLGMRNDQYFLALLFAVVLNPHDYIIGVKMIIILVWMGAGVSKFGRHFEYVVPVMMANAPYMLSKRISRLFFRKHPHDLQPSKLSLAMAHGLGTVVELICPLVLLLSGNAVAAGIAAFVIIGMHVVIVLSMPIAVPLEWNIHYILLTVFIFFGFPAWEGFGIGDISSVGAGAFIFFCVLVGPVVGNLKPEWISFLISMRQYAGNWACTVWAFSPEGIEKMYKDYPGAIPPPEEIIKAGFGEEAKFKLMDKVLSWRAMHSQGRGLLSVLKRELGSNIDGYHLREGEYMSAWLLGWNFGEGHFHGPTMWPSVPKHLQFEPGECVVAFVESQPIHKKAQRYMVYDMALGVLETGSWKVKDCIAEQPWLPNGPIPVNPDAEFEGRKFLHERIALYTRDAQEPVVPQS